MAFPKWAYNICGNFGMGIFSPFIGVNLGETIFNLGYTIDQLFLISLMGGVVSAGMSISKEALERGKAKWK